MGYEISGGWGAAMARATIAPDGRVIVFVGDGSYLMMNSDLYSLGARRATRWSSSCATTAGSP